MHEMQAALVKLLSWIQWKIVHLRWILAFQYMDCMKFKVRWFTAARPLDYDLLIDD